MPKCENRNFNTGSRRGKAATPCTKDAVAVVRIKGSEYYACSQHKTLGIFVKPIKGSK